MLFMHEGEQIHRSSHALVHDHADVSSDANSAEQLFAALKDRDCIVFAHIGGRYADIRAPLDNRREQVWQFGGPIAVVPVQEHDDVWSIDCGKAGETGATIATPRLVQNLGPHITRNLCCSVG